MFTSLDLLRKAPPANPTLATILEVEQILRDESRATALPLSISEIERRMQAKRTRRGTVKAAVEALVHYGVAASGPKGVFYIRVSAKEAARATEPLA